LALIGIVTATLASWVFDMVNENNQQDRAVTSAEITELKQQNGGRQRLRLRL